MKRIGKRWIPAALLALAAAFWLYTADYYRADEAAKAALVSDGAVAVSRTDYGWLFDGPSGERALIFYPGAKVEETAYAPFLHTLAAQGVDVCLVRMPFHLAVFGINRADAVIRCGGYSHWSIGGHSLGGAMAARYAADHEEALDGLVLCAAYSPSALGEALPVTVVYGTEDGVLNRERLKKSRPLLSGPVEECVSAGGNHAQGPDGGRPGADFRRGAAAGGREGDRGCLAYGDSSPGRRKSVTFPRRTSVAFSSAGVSSRLMTTSSRPWK